MGVQTPGSEASSCRTAARLPGAMSSCAPGSPRMGCVLRGSVDRGREDGREDAREAGAAAEIAGEAFADFSHGWMGISLEELGRGHQHAGGANAALRAAALEKCLLQR